MSTRTAVQQAFMSNLKRYMGEHPDTNVEIARRLEIDKSTLYRYMSGDAFPPLTKLAVIANFFGVTDHDMLDKPPRA